MICYDAVYLLIDILISSASIGKIIEEGCKKKLHTLRFKFLIHYMI